MAGATTPEEKAKLKGRKVRDSMGVLFGVIEDVLQDPQLQQPRYAVIRFPITRTQGYKARRTVMPLELIDDLKGGPFLRFKSMVLAQGPAYNNDATRLPHFVEYWTSAAIAYGQANETLKRFHTPLYGTMPDTRPAMVDAAEPPTVGAP
ncbi:MAG TPA: hypothetical protein VGN26_18880 [Armatimonadota bacterium]|jgi:hypothetical protein